jgi:hypothetical protein
VAEEKVSLELIAKQQERSLEEQAAMRDDMAVLLGMVQRLDGTVQGLVTEIRAIHSRQARLDRRVGKLEEERN